MLNSDAINDVVRKILEERLAKAEEEVRAIKEVFGLRGLGRPTLEAAAAATTLEEQLEVKVRKPKKVGWGGKRTGKGWPSKKKIENEVVKAAEKMKAKTKRGTRTSMEKWKEIVTEWMKKNQPASRAEIMGALNMSSGGTFQKLMAALMKQEENGSGDWVLDDRPIGMGLDGGQSGGVEEVTTSQDQQ